MVDTCIFADSTVSQTSHGPQLTVPIYDLLLTRALKNPAALRSLPAAQLTQADEVVVVEWQVNQKARAMAAKLTRIAVRAGVVAFSVVNLVSI
jgi:hypothetical protein